MLSQIQVMSLNALSVTLADNVQLSLQAGFIQQPAIRHPYHDLKGRQQAQKTLQRGKRALPKTCLNIQIKHSIWSNEDTVSPIRPNGGNMSEFELLAQDLLEKAEVGRTTATGK